MNKPPAFQFYPQDYLSSARVAEMTLEEEGVYIRLLCYCWASGSIPADPERCAKLAGKGCSIETATNVQRAFNVRSTDGQRLLHDRLEKEREKQEKHRELASFAGKKSAESRAKKHVKPYVETTSNGRSTDVQRKVNSSSSSSDEDGVSSERKKRNVFQVPEFDDVKGYIKAGEFDYVDPEAFYAHYQSNGWMVGKNRVKDWKACVRTWNARAKSEGKPKVAKKWDRFFYVGKTNEEASRLYHQYLMEHPDEP